MKNLIQYYIINEDINNVNTKDIINNLKNVYNIKENIIYNNIIILTKSNLYKIKD